MLTPILVTPLVGAAMLSTFNNTDVSENTVVRIKQIAISASLITFFISIIMYCQFDSTSPEYQFTEEFNQVDFCHLYIGVDGISLYFVMLTTFITPVCILSN